MVRTGDGHRLYDYDENRKVQSEKVGPSELALPFIHLAYEALLFVPFSLLIYQSAHYSFLIINFLVLIWCYQMLRPHLSSLVEVWQYLPAAILGCFLPNHHGPLTGAEFNFVVGHRDFGGCPVGARTRCVGGVFFRIDLHKISIRSAYRLTFSGVATMAIRRRFCNLDSVR